MDKKINIGRCAGKSQKVVSSLSKELEKKGCSLEIAFRALYEGIYVENCLEHSSLEKHEVRGIGQYGLDAISNICGYAECDFTCKYENYKKTWWLKEDKSE